MIHPEHHELVPTQTANCILYLSPLWVNFSCTNLDVSQTAQVCSCHKAFASADFLSGIPSLNLRGLVLLCHSGSV